MLEMIKAFIGNAAIMIAGFYLAGKLFKEPLTHHSHIREKIKTGAASGVLGFLLMNFSIQVTNDVIIDLRHIPVIVIAYFGGMIPALIATIIIALSRFIFGINDASLLAFIYMMLVGISSGMISKYFRKSSYVTILLMNIVSMVLITIVLSILIHDNEVYKTIIYYFWGFAIPSGVFATVFFNDFQRSKALFLQYLDAAKTDYLTGLDNVRQFDASFNELIKVSQEKNEQLSLLLIDIDHFKKVNDTYGHDAGDSVLQQLGVILKKTARSFDRVSRNGGEEFSVILLDCPLQQAIEIGERIRNAVENHQFVLPNNSKIIITVSIGTSSYPKTANTSEDLFKQADQALYKAKASGRNQVTCLGTNQTFN